MKKQNKRTVPMTTYLTMEEAGEIKKWVTYTGSKSASDLLRKMLYMVGGCCIRIRLNHEDLTEIHDMLNLCNIYFIKMVEELLKHDEVDMDAVEALRRQMDDFNNRIEKCYRLAFFERNSRRQGIERYLMDRMDNLLRLSKGI